MDSIIATFQSALRVTKDPVAAALLVLATELHDFDHQLCLGIRHGIFGKDATDSESIKDVID